MKIRSLFIFAMLHASPALAAASTYDCVVNDPRAVSFKGQETQIDIITGLPPESLRFAVTLSEKTAKVDWPASPFQMSGENPIFSTGKDSGSVLFLSSGPCLFTDGACGSMLNFAKQPDGALAILITPTAFATDETTRVTLPFLVAIEGNCRLRKGQR